MNWRHLLIGVAAASLLAACSSSKPPETAPVMNTPSASDGSASSAAAPTSVDPLKDPNSPLAQRSVYFDFDSSEVKDDYKGMLGAHADYLKGHNEHKITIQGNTDSRGSREYNLALGQRRAESVKRSFEVLGVPDKQLEAVSLGKEKPISTGNTEEDYAKNRRADIVYDGQ